MSGSGRRSFAAGPRNFSRARCSRMLAALAVMSRTVAISAGVSCSQAHSRSSSASSGRSAASASCSVGVRRGGAGATCAAGRRRRSARPPAPAGERPARRCAGSCAPRRTPTAAARRAGRRPGASRPAGSRRARRRRWPASVRRARNRRSGSISSGATASKRSRRLSSTLKPHTAGRTVACDPAQPSDRDRVTGLGRRSRTTRTAPRTWPGPGLGPFGWSCVVRGGGLRSPCRPCHRSGRRPWAPPSPACRRRRPRW